MEFHNKTVIITGASVGIGKANMADYSMTKGAVSSFTKAVALPILYLQKRLADSLKSYALCTQIVNFSVCCLFGVEIKSA